MNLTNFFQNWYKGKTKKRFTTWCIVTITLHYTEESHDIRLYIFLLTYVIFCFEIEGVILEHIQQDKSANITPLDEKKKKYGSKQLVNKILSIF